MGSIACDNPSPAVCFAERRYQNRNLQLPRPLRSHPPACRARAEGEEQVLMAYPSNRWTPDEDKLLRELVLENAAPFEIAAQLGRSISSVRARAHRLGIPLGFLLR
jgi:DNA-directed RNA polymerase specialized sigma24 family protein